MSRSDSLLRMLTSLTHDNALAAEQMTICNDFVLEHEFTSSASIRGIDLLAELVYRLDEEHESQQRASRHSKAHAKNGRKKTANDQDLQRYDSTIFCLNTLANIIEAEGVRRILAELHVPNEDDDDDESMLWLEWLCQWFVEKTEGFQDAIMSIGNDRGSSDRELEKHEEDRLVAAGNGCVLLACLMKEPEEISEAPESTNTIRNLILDQMPSNEDGTSTGATLIINTLKAFCNFYQFSLGELSVAVVTPVKKLIEELEELQKSGI